MRTFVFTVVPTDKACGEVRGRFLLEAAHLFAALRGFPPQAVGWLGDTFVVGRFRFRVEEK